MIKRGHGDPSRERVADVMMYGALHLAHEAHQPLALSVATIAILGLVAGATVLGAWLARRFGRRDQALVAAAASGVLLAVAAVHLLPDAFAPPGGPGRSRWSHWLGSWAR